MANRTYDVLKNIALIVLPALATLVLTICKIWGFSYGDEIAATITAIDVFLGALLQISTAQYNKTMSIEAEDESEIDDEIDEE